MRGLMDRLRHREPDGVRGFPCAECGRPAIGWAVVTREHHGAQVIDGSPACEAHLSPAAEELREKVG